MAGPVLYPLLVSFGFLLVLVAPNANPVADKRLKYQYYWLQFIMLVSAAIGAKLAVLWGDWDWPRHPMSWPEIATAGRSLTGGLLFGFIGPEIAKYFMKYPLPPNDRFAATLPFSLAIGRLGCLLDGCCRGTPWDGLCAIVYSDGIPRHPAQLYEIIFQLITGVFFIYLVKRGLLFGRVFCLYMVLYGVFRFLTEFVRDTPKYENGYSAYQYLAVIISLTGLLVLIKRTLYPPKSWDKYRAQAMNTNTKSPHERSPYGEPVAGSTSA